MFSQTPDVETWSLFTLQLYDCLPGSVAHRHGWKTSWHLVKRHQWFGFNLWFSLTSLSCFVATEVTLEMSQRLISKRRLLSCKLSWCLFKYKNVLLPLIRLEMSQCLVRPIECFLADECLNTSFCTAQMKFWLLWIKWSLWSGAVSQ